MTQALDAAVLLPHLFRSDKANGWSQGMRAVTHALLGRTGFPPGPVLEVGCGGGRLLAELRRTYPGRALVGTDLHPLALAHARHQAQATPLVQAALPALPWRAEQFALVLALDVFDQQGVDLAAALAESRRVLLPGGLLLLRVSAYPWLYGPHDVAFHTGRRYTRGELRMALQRAGLRVERITHANTGLAAPVMLQRLAQRWGLAPWRPGLYANGALHRVAAILIRREAAWLRHGDLPLGLSLFALARKPPSDPSKEAS
jgi:SAM-dependent methyltransferase